MNLSSSSRHPVRLLLALVLSCALVAGCSGGSTTGTANAHAAKPKAAAANWLSPADATVEYRSVAAKLTLAPNWSWPQSPIRGSGPDGRPARYERGFGLMSADWYWFCSWGHQLVQAPVRGSQYQQALGQLATVKQRYWYQKSLSSGERAGIDTEIAQAKKGQTSAMATEVRLNCPARTS